VVMAIIRKTYGFNKKTDEIGLSQLSLMTGIEKGNLSRTVKELEVAKVIHRGEGVHAHTFSINKRSKQWELSNQQPQLSKQQPLLKQQPKGCQNDNEGVVESTTEGLSEQQPQNTSLKTSQKTTSKDVSAGALADRFDVFYSAYPKKRNRGRAKKAFEKLNPNDSLLQTMLEAVEVAKRCRDDWRKDGGQYIPYAEAWLNAEGWLDEVDQTSYTTVEQAVIDAYNRVMSDDWPHAVSDPFSPARASDIRLFLEFAPEKPDMPARYFEHCQANLKPSEHLGFDWLISRETYIRVKEDAVKHKETA
jgi:phage replication O-like protein O